MKGFEKAKPLEGKTIIFLGSSVTFGLIEREESFVEFLKMEDGVVPIKEAVPGTTMVDNGEQSYIARMKKLNARIPADMLICQLSTNDAASKQPLGAVSTGRRLEDFDTHTVAGALEYIIVYAKQTWGCPVAIYTSARYENAEYEAMVALLMEIQSKWEIGVIDLWSNEQLNSIDDETRSRYMIDSVHPTREGYREWWLPVFEKYLYERLKG